MRVFGVHCTSLRPRRMKSSCRCDVSRSLTQRAELIRGECECEREPRRDEMSGKKLKLVSLYYDFKKRENEKSIFAVIPVHANKCVCIYGFQVMVLHATWHERRMVSSSDE